MLYNTPMPALLVFFICMMCEISTLTISCWNSRGYLSSIPYLRYILRNNLIVATSEHWLHKNRLNVLYDISTTHNYLARSSKYSSSKTYWSTRGQGGVAIFWSKDINGVSVISNITPNRICSIQVQLSSGLTLSILSVYLPAVGGDDHFPNCLDELDAIVEFLSQTSEVIVCGDFNADVGSGGGPKGDVPPTKRGQLLLSFINRYDLCVTNLAEYASGPTHTHVGP